MTKSRSPWGSIAALLLSTIASAAPQPPGTPAPVTIAQRFTIESKTLQETRTYLVHTPSGYDFTNERYPVVVLIDGESNIHHVSATTDFLANNGRAMPMIVVGIENTDRQRDLTPPIVQSPPEERPDGKLGGAQNFLTFIADELLPQIDRTYRTRPTRILVGHSYGGLFASYALLNRPEAFKAYISVSPSLWWDRQALAAQAVTFAAEHKDLQTAMFVTMGSEGGAMLGGAQRFVGALTSGENGIQATFQRWPNESHGSVVMRSVYEGFNWLYEFYYRANPIQTYEESGLRSFDKRFEEISKYLGYEVKIPEGELMQIQNWLRETKRWEEARQVLERIVQIYPQAMNARYDLGRVKVELGDRAGAEADFRRVLEQYPGDPGSREALDKLGVAWRTIVVDKQPAASVLRSYVGEYRYADEPMRIVVEDGKLFAHPRNDKLELRALSDTDFYAYGLDREYTFNKKGGRVVSVTVRLPAFTYDSVRQR
jgi:predicted alpha/beta superfamily hydrolase